MSLKYYEILFLLHEDYRYILATTFHLLFSLKVLQIFSSLPDEFYRRFEISASHSDIRPNISERILCCGTLSSQRLACAEWR